MTENQEKAIQCLKDFQEQSLIERFGENYLTKHKEIFRKTKKTDFLNEYFKSQLNLTDEENAEMTKEYNNSLKSSFVQTKYEVSQPFALLSMLFERVEVAATKLSYSLNKRPFIGTAFSKEFNAFAARVTETEESIIVFESELFTLCNQLAKIIASCLPDFRIEKSGVSFSFNKDRIENHIETNFEIKERFADFVINAILQGQPNKTKQYFLSGEAARLHYELLNSLELFIVGHEYGHIYAGHIDNALVKRRMINDKQFAIISPDWQMELEADFYGLNLLVNVDETQNFLPFSILGPELFFTFLDINERAISLVYDGKEVHSDGSDEHPPTTERRKQIRELLSKSLPKTHLDSYQIAGEFLENVLEILWDDFKTRTPKK